MRLLIVSNRLPFSASTEDGKLSFRESVGGLVSGLSSYLGSLKDTPFTQENYLWIGWPGVSVEEHLQSELRQTMLDEFHAWPVFLEEAAMDDFYHGFCNKTLWPLFHYFPSYTTYEETTWHTYQAVNERFCEVVLQIAQPDDVVWVQDYHLMLLPRLLRERAPDLAIGFFLHIPFPTYEIFRLLPSTWRAALLQGLLGADLVGFHTYDDTQYFLTCVRRILGLEPAENTLQVDQRIVRVGAFPISIEVQRFATAVQKPEVQQAIQDIRERLVDQTAIISVDRLDYSKGILNRLQGYEIFLERNPHWHGRVTLLLVVVPSRIGVEHYQLLRKQIDEVVGRINGRYSTIHWTPVIYQYRYMPIDLLTAFYAASDIALITPLRDGMNLVAKEYVATRTDKTGVLILSEMAGAAKELTEAIIINPNNRDEIATAICAALEMPREEQIRRNEVMQARLRRYDVVMWANDVIETLLAVKEQQRVLIHHQCTPLVVEQIQQAYQAARRRLVLLDYDGTLVPFAATPEGATPSSQVIDLLAQLSADPANRIVIVSGRTTATLDAWLGGLPLTLVAEHGVWLKEPGQRWIQTGAPSADWKPLLRRLLEVYVDRVPGSLIEEKDFCLVWHHRKVQAELGEIKAKELAHDLEQMTEGMELDVLQGNKVVEVRMPAFNKGAIARHIIGSYRSDFILAIGDDWTDEDLFKALPEQAYSVKIGLPPTAARWHMPSQTEVLPFLYQLAAPVPVLR